MTSRIRLKCESSSLSVKLKILQIFNNFSIKCSNVIPNGRNNTEFFALCNSDAEADKIFDVNCCLALRAIKCSPIMPMKLKAKRSVLLKHIDSYIYDHSVDEIKFQVTENNDSLDVVEVYKFPNSKIVKITFTNYEMAEKCLKDGVKLFLLYLPPSNVYQDEFVEVKTCYKCFKLNDHLTYECPEDSNFLVCSKCATLGHSFKECSADYKRCLNCNQPHPSLSFSCPKRKFIVKEILNGRANDSKKSYASVCQTSGIQPPINYDIIHDSVVKSVMCLLVAGAKEKESPGSFIVTLDSLQKTNNVPNFQLGDISLPTTFLSSLTPANPMRQPDLSHDTPTSNMSQLNLSTNQTPPPTPVIHTSTSQPAESRQDLNSNVCRSDAQTNLAPPSISTEPNVCHVNTQKNVAPPSISTEHTQSTSKISIIKSRNCPLVTSKNLAALYEKDLIRFESGSGCSGEQCINFFSRNLLECKSAISKAITKDFRTLRSGISYK